MSVSITFTVTNTEAFSQPSCNVFVSVFFIHLLSSFQLFCCFSCFFVFSSSQSSNKNNSGCPQTSPFGNCTKTRHSIQFKPTTHMHIQIHAHFALLCFPAQHLDSIALLPVCCVTVSISSPADQKHLDNSSIPTYLEAHTVPALRPPPPTPSLPSKRCANISIILSRLLANLLLVYRLLHNNKIKCLLSHTQTHTHTRLPARARVCWIVRTLGDKRSE